MTIGDPYATHPRNQYYINNQWNQYSINKPKSSTKEERSNKKDVVNDVFQPQEFLSSSTVELIWAGTRILPNASSLQEADELPTLDQVILTERSFICEEIGAGVLPHISD